MGNDIRQRLQQAPIDLATFNEPIRLAVLDQEGRPRIVSLWYEYQHGCFYCATHRDAWLTGRLRKEAIVGYEIATSKPPYCGVRGTAEASVQMLGQSPLLESLIERYLGDSHSQLTSWLLSRRQDEVIITLTPTLVSAWDYSDRMQPLESASG